MSSNSICRCECKTNPGEFCDVCMGRYCQNNTYEWNGKIYNLVKATMLWTLGSLDGPMHGIAICGCFFCYAEAYTLYRRPRSYWLYPITVKEFREESSLHASHFRIWKVNRKSYKNRDPLGFFRFSNSINPLRQNLILDKHQENWVMYKNFFKDQTNERS